MLKECHLPRKTITHWRFCVSTRPNISPPTFRNGRLPCTVFSTVWSSRTNHIISWHTRKPNFWGHLELFSFYQHKSAAVLPNSRIWACQRRHHFAGNLSRNPAPLSFRSALYDSTSTGLSKALFACDRDVCFIAGVKRSSSIDKDWSGWEVYKIKTLYPLTEISVVIIPFTGWQTNANVYSFVFQLKSLFAGDVDSGACYSHGRGRYSAIRVNGLGVAVFGWNWRNYLFVR